MMHAISASCRRRTCARSRRTSRASRSPSWRARWGSQEASIVKLASNENPLGIGPRTRAAIEAAIGELARYPGRQRLRAEAGARPGATASTWPRSCSATARTTCSSWWRAPSSGRARRGLSRSTASRSIRSRPRRAARARSGAGEGLRPRPRGDGEGGRRRDLRRAGSPTRTTRPARSRAASELEAFLRARAGARAGGARRGLQRVPAARAAAPTRVRWLKRHPEPGHHAHLLQGLRPGRPARRLRARASRGRRPDEPRAPAVQRQQPGARRGGRGARRHGVRRAQLRRATCRGMRQIEEGARASASTSSRRTATSSPCGSARRREIFKRLLKRGVIVRPVAAPTAARAPARHGRHAAGERALPRRARARAA